MPGYLKSPLIKLQLGPSESTEEVLVHKDILTKRSKFIANALSKRWNGSNDKIINLHDLLPDVKYDYFAYYLDVLYKNSMAQRLKDPGLLNICYVYIIAEALLDIETRNLAVKALYDWMREKNRYPTMTTVAKIYSHTASASNPMRRLLVEVWHDMGCPKWYEGHEDVAPPEFLWDLALKNFSRSRNTSAPIEYNIDDFMEKQVEEEEEKNMVQRSGKEGASGKS